jgi:hypothetical protein
MGMVGVAVLVGLDPIPLSGVVLPSVGASLLAALRYALAGVYAKRTFSDVPALALGIGQQAGTAILYPWPPPAYPERHCPSQSCSPCWEWLCSRRRRPTCSNYRFIANGGPTKTLSVTFFGTYLRCAVRRSASERARGSRDVRRDGNHTLQRRAGYGDSFGKGQEEEREA